MVSLRARFSAVAAQFADFVRGVVGERRAAGEAGVAFAEASWAKWGVKPYRADDLLKSKALRLAVYREMMRDPVVKAALLSRVFAVMTTEWDLRPAGYDRRTERDPKDPRVQATDFLREVLSRPKGRWPKLIFDLSQALVDGFAVIEKVYAAVEDGPWAGRIGLAALKAKDVDTWDFDCDEFLNVMALRQQVQGVWYDRDRSKFIVFSWLPVFENPLGQSEFRAAYRAFWLKDTGLKFRAIYLESLAKGRRKVTYPADQGAAGLEKAQALLTLMENSIGIAVPADLQVELIELAVAPDAVFENMLARCDKEIVIGLEGAVLQMLEGSETGAYRATETHRKQAAPWTLVFGLFLEAAIQDELVADLTRLNFAGAEPPDFYFRWAREDLEPFSVVIQRAQQMGLRIPAWFLYEQFDIPEPEPEDEVLAPRATLVFPPASAAPGGGAGGAAEMADPPAGADPREAAIDRAVARAPEAYRSLFEILKKKGRKTFGRPSMP
jgi:phage gp29-like protein